MLVVASLGALALPSLAHATFPGANGKFLGSNGDIFTQYPDGSHFQYITTGPATDTVGSWSADGRRIAFHSNEDGNYEIFVINADGTGRTQLTHTAAPALNSGAYWSPDGTKLAFGSNRDWPPPFSPTQTELYVMNADGTNETRITTDGNVRGGGRWSPDGTKLAVQFAPTFTTFVMNPDGTGRTELTPRPGPMHYPDWSPDGSRIVVTGAVNNPCNCTPQDNELYRGFPPTIPFFQLTATYGACIMERNPIHSPDGTKIAYWRQVQCSPTSNYPYVMNVDGTGNMQLPLNGSAPFSIADWQPCPRFCPPNRIHDIPTVASPLQVSLVPDFRQTISSTQCSARGGTTSSHGPPLAFTSCQPPAFAPGTQAHMGTASSASASLVVIEGDATTPNADEADLSTTVNATDIRQGTASGADYDPVASGADTTLATKVRLTDLSNCVSNCDPSFYTGGTVLDFELNVPVDCVSTADPSVGSTCNANTSMDAVYADSNAVKEGTSMIMQQFRLRLKDAGTNGIRGDADDRGFAMQGIYIP